MPTQDTPRIGLPDPVTSVDALISNRLRSPDYRTWRARVQATGGCAAPVHLRGSSTVLDRDGAVLIERTGEVMAPCGNRRESVCPACSDRYAADAYHLLRAGLAGGTKGVPTTVTDRPRAFVTLTAPSFGPVHTRRVTARGQVIPCGCGERHRPDDPRISSPVDPDGYDYVGAVLWQAHAGQLWHRFTIALRRALAAHLNLPARAFPDVARLSYAKVAEYQRRGLVHFHAAIRLDGPDGPTDPPPAGLDDTALRAAIATAAASTAVTTRRPDGTPLVLRWGAQLDIRAVTSTAATQIEDTGGQISDAALAGYIAKYATKGTGTSDGTDRPIRDGDHIAYLDVTPHHRRMIETVWQLGGVPAYAALNLRAWAHMLGFRGHFLTKSQRYSTTFTAIRNERRTWRLAEDLAALDAATDDTNTIPADPASVVVVNDWAVIRIGHRDHGERELALAIAERNRQQRHSTSTRGGEGGMKVNNRLWTVQDVAEYLGVPVGTLYDWRAKGYGPKGKRVGRSCAMTRTSSGSASRSWTETLPDGPPAAPDRHLRRDRRHADVRPATSLPRPGPVP